MGSPITNGALVITPSSSPFVVAHRAGNCIEELRRVEQLGVALVEADVRLFRGRAEIRHLKTVGPLPLYWDRWELASPRRRHLSLADLLAATGTETELMLDLKGRRKALAYLVRGEVESYLPGRRLTVCARDWRLLDVFVDLPVRRIASVGSSRQLRTLLDRFAGNRLDGVSIHERLLDERVVAELRQVADLVLTWPVNVPARARQLLRIGVDGLITDHVERLASVAAVGARA